MPSLPDLRPCYCSLSSSTLLNQPGGTLREGGTLCFTLTSVAALSRAALLPAAFSAALSDAAFPAAALLPRRCDILTVAAPAAGLGEVSQCLELAKYLEASLIVWRITAHLTPDILLAPAVQEEGEACLPDGQPQQGRQRRCVKLFVPMVAQDGQKYLRG